MAVGKPVRHFDSLKSLPAVIGLVIASVIVVACGDEGKNIVPDAGNMREVPTMVTRNVETFISDSGITRYHITAKLWNIYDEAKVPRWTFPNGVFLEQYDNLFRQSAKVVCDSATFFSMKKLWRLDGDVVMVNVARDTFMTKQLFWDQRMKRLYSDTAFIRIVSKSRIIEGYGFSSNEEMTDYAIKKPTAIFPAKNMRNGADNAAANQEASSSPATTTPNQTVPPPKNNAKGLKISTTTNHNAN